ncbi:MAG: hypothetical protein HY352_04125 [Candidatus Omnitrophica bacterium]|nr:hypothetical protein [Candidatus Omnitrophota bacterium]
MPPLNVHLLGTLIADGVASSVAIVEDGVTGKRQSYRVGETVQGRQLLAIARGEMTLRNGREEVRVGLEAGSEANEMGMWESLVEQIIGPQALSEDETQTLTAAIHPVSETEWRVDREVVWSVLKEHPFQLAREAALRPTFTGGKLVGVRFASVPTDGILHQSGFQTGDVIRAVNGQSVTDPALMLRLSSQLTQADVIQVQVERDDHPVTLTYQMR